MTSKIFLGEFQKQKKVHRPFLYYIYRKGTFRVYINKVTPTTIERRGGKKVIVCCTSLSIGWNLVMPSMRRHPLPTKEQGSIKKYANADCWDAPRDGKQWLIETRFGECHCQKVRHGTLHSSSLMELGSAHACHRHN